MPRWNGTAGQRSIKKPGASKGTPKKISFGTKSKTTGNPSHGKRR